MKTVPLGKARFSVATGPQGETLSIPAPRNPFIMAFLSVWLALWTVGGASALASFTATHRPFLAFWLVAWALGWAYAAAILGWMAFGREVLEVRDGNLVLARHVGGFVRRKAFLGGAIRQIGVERAALVAWWMQRGQLPFGSQAGSVGFTYGERRQKFGAGLDEAEAAAVADWLLQRFPDARSAPWPSSD